MDTLRQMMSDAGVRKTNIVLFDACREELRGKTTKKPKSFKGNPNLTIFHEYPYRHL
jgi:hypothetical protein